MLVRDKKKDIAILRTIGATRNNIMMIFIINGLFIGLVGTICGLVLGVSFANNIDSIRLFLEKVSGVNIFEAAIYFLSYLPSKILITDVLMVSAMSTLLSFIATIYPAYKASSLDPVEAMRYE